MHMHKKRGDIMVGNKPNNKIKGEIIHEFQYPLKIRGLTTMEISKRLGIPKETARVHLEQYESDGFLEAIFVGKTKIYGLKKKNKSKT